MTGIKLLKELLMVLLWIIVFILFVAIRFQLIVTQYLALMLATAFVNMIGDD